MAPQHMLYFYYCAQNNVDLFSEDLQYVFKNFKVNHDNMIQLQ